MWRPTSTEAMQVLTVSCREPRFHPPNFLIFQGTLQVCFSFKGKSPGQCYNTDTTVIDSCLRNTFCVFHPCRVWKTGRAGQKYLADVWTAAWSLQWELAGQLQPPLQRLHMTLSILINEDNTGNLLNDVGYTCRCFKPMTHSALCFSSCLVSNRWTCFASAGGCSRVWSGPWSIRTSKIITGKLYRSAMLGVDTGSCVPADKQDKYRAVLDFPREGGWWGGGPGTSCQHVATFPLRNRRMHVA